MTYKFVVTVKSYTDMIQLQRVLCSEEHFVRPAEVFVRRYKAPKKFIPCTKCQHYAREQFGQYLCWKTKDVVTGCLSGRRKTNEK